MGRRRIVILAATGTLVTCLACGAIALAGRPGNGSGPRPTATTMAAVQPTTAPAAAPPTATPDSAARAAELLAQLGPVLRPALDATDALDALAKGIAQGTGGSASELRQQAANARDVWQSARAALRRLQPADPELAQACEDLRLGAGVWDGALGSLIDWIDYRRQADLDEYVAARRQALQLMTSGLDKLGAKAK